MKINYIQKTTQTSNQQRWGDITLFRSSYKFQEMTGGTKVHQCQYVEVFIISRFQKIHKMTDVGVCHFTELFVSDRKFHC